jgi:methylamine---glutamate N-methyltransferase subunit B
MRDEHVDELATLLERAEVDGCSPADFRRYGSARKLYNFHVDNAGEY